MECGRRSGWARRPGYGLTATALLAAALVGCGSSSASPSGGASTSVAPATSAAPDAAPVTQAGFLKNLNNVTTVASTIPPNLDVNPYALLVTPVTTGKLTQGHVLVDNFNAKSNFQGTGSTIVDISPEGTLTQFAQLPQDQPGCPGGIGLSTAMTVLKTGGWVIVGSAPSTDGTTGTAGAGCLLVLNPQGQVVKTIADANIDGPWDMYTVDNGSTATLYVTNTFLGIGASGQPVQDKGTVLRMQLSVSASAPPTVTSETVIGSGFPEQSDPGSFVNGPTGDALGANGTLYVSDRLGNRIAEIPNAATRPDSAGTGTTLTSGGKLSAPLSMTIAPNGDLLVANALNGQLVEITPAGQQIANVWLDQDQAQSPAGSGDLFGITMNASNTGVYFVMDDNNALGLLS